MFRENNSAAFKVTFHTSRFLSSQTSPSPAPPHFRLMILPFYLQVTPSTHLSFGCSSPQLLLRGFSQAIASFSPFLIPPHYQFTFLCWLDIIHLNTNSLNLPFSAVAANHLVSLPACWGHLGKKKTNRTLIFTSPHLFFSQPSHLGLPIHIIIHLLD